jgi:hypothetical protein
MRRTHTPLGLTHGLTSQSITSKNHLSAFQLASPIVMEVPMHFRRSAAVVLAAAALLSTACQTKLDDRGVVQSGSFSVFDPTTNAIPLPNDLALAQVPAAAVLAGCGAALPTAQAQFLCSLAASGGFPNDQEVRVTFAFQQQSVTSAGAVLTDPVALDTTTVKVLGTVPSGATVAVFDVTNAPTIVPVVVQASFLPATSTLELRKPAAADGSRRWTAGHKYVAFVRGGPSGVKTAAGGTIEPMPTMYVLREAIISNRDLTDPANQTLIPGTFEQKAAAGARLEPIRRGYRPLKAVYEAAFGAGSFSDMVNLLTFTIAPSAGVVVEVDATKGSAPLPIDMLRAPDAAGGLILDNSAYGSARVGIVQLDGFSTTGAITAPLTGGVANLLDAATIGTASGNVLVYDLSTTPPTLLKEFNQELQTGGLAAARAAAFIAQPPGTFVPAGVGQCPATNLAGAPIGGCASSLVLQPAVPISAVGAYLPPLKGGTKYGVVVTKRVKDILGRSLARSTAARILLELAAPVDASIGVDAGTAALLQQMRTDLAPVFTNLPAGTAKSDIAMAYVFKTQGITPTSLALSAAPHSLEQRGGSAVFLPTTITSVMASYPQVAGAAAVYEITFNSLDATSKATGALDPVILTTTNFATIQAAIHPLKALVAVPSGFTGARPLVLFGHGLSGSKRDLLVSDGVPPVNALLARGFIVAATDFPQHGDRTWCFASSDCGTGPLGSGGDGTCTPFAAGVPPGYQGDSASCGGTPLNPGVCTVGTPFIDASSALNKSGQTFIGANFFRTRDAFRQNLIDQSALALALARPAWAPAVPGTLFTARLAADGIDVSTNPDAVYWEGISLGGITGTEILATNPRFTEGVLAAPGATLFDLFTSSPAFQPRVTPLLSCLLKEPLDAIGAGGFTTALVNPADPSFSSTVAAAYGKIAITAKWILDPGDPLNYARHLRTEPLPNIVLHTAGAAKSVLGMISAGDAVIENKFNLELFTNGGTVADPLPTVTYTSGGTFTGRQMHGLLGFFPLAQTDAATFLFNGAVPPNATIP